VKAARVLVDCLLWLAWIAAAVSGSLTGVAITALTAVTVGVARQDWANGARLFTKIH
jgi:hypothetical protein